MGYWPNEDASHWGLPVTDALEFVYCPTGESKELSKVNGL